MKTASLYYNRQVFDLKVKLIIGILIVVAALSELYITYVKPDVANDVLADKVIMNVTYNKTNKTNSPEINTDALYTELPNCVGYIYNEQFDIHYPIMQSSTRDYYLTRDLNGNYSRAGAIFLDSNNNWEDSLTLISGHNMKNGSMFGNLDKVNIGEIFTILKGTQVYTYEVMDKNIRHDTDVIYSLENPYYFDCIVLSTCKGKEDRLTLTLKQR